MVQVAIFLSLAGWLYHDESLFFISLPLAVSFLGLSVLMFFLFVSANSEVMMIIVYAALAQDGPVSDEK